MSSEIKDPGLHKVLVVDDDVRICKLLKNALSQKGFNVIALDNGDSFEEILLGFMPETIILDVRMPDRDGIELLRLLSHHRSTAAVFIVTGIAENITHTTEKLAQKLGVNLAGIVAKPFDLDDLATRIELQPARVATEKRRDDPILSGDAITEAINSGQITPYFQPKIELSSGRVSDVEMLARWKDDDGVSISPEVLFNAAAEYGLTHGLTMHLIKTSFHMSRLWRNFDFPEVGIAFNICPLVLDDIALPEKLDKLTRHYKFHPNEITLEITETEVFIDEQRAMDTLTRLALRGFRLSIDDFGTGHSSMTKLCDLPFHELKIDRKFVKEMNSNRASRLVVETSIALSRELGMKIVAEGIEDVECRQALQKLDCRYGQGYLFSPALEINSFTSWLRKWNGAAGSGPLTRTECA